MVAIFFAIILLPNVLGAFDKVILWGHKLHSHTHSYIHNGFYKAFKHMGYKTYWLDNNDQVDNLDFSDALFITEGQVDRCIPLRDDCHYILHNCDEKKYKRFLEAGHAITLQVYTDDVLSRAATKIEDFIYYDLTEKCIYMPWATDLLPYEIDAIKQTLQKVKKQKTVWWVGSVLGGEFGNTQELNPFIKACAENGITFKTGMQKSIQESIKAIQESAMAPAIVGEWQQRVGYIPCRIFKNISYGQMGITNSRHVYELFKKKIVYNPDTYQLFYDAQKRFNTLTQDEIGELIDLVRDNHTYINRIERLLSFLKLIEETYGNN